MFSPEVVEDFPPQEIAFEWFDDSVDLPLGTALIQKEILNAVPTGKAVKFAVGPVIEELTVLLAHILLVLLTVLDLHNLSPSNSIREEINLEYKKI